jgi:predicted permease
MLKKAMAQLAIILTPLLGWLGVGFLLYPSCLLKLAAQLEEEIDLPAIKVTCYWIAFPCLILSIFFFIYWLRSRHLE